MLDFLETFRIVSFYQFLSLVKIWSFLNTYLLIYEDFTVFQFSMDFVYTFPPMSDKTCINFYLLVIPTQFFQDMGKTKLYLKSKKFWVISLHHFWVIFEKPRGWGGHMPPMLNRVNFQSLFRLFLDTSKYTFEAFFLSSRSL